MRIEALAKLVSFYKDDHLLRAHKAVVPKHLFDELMTTAVYPHRRNPPRPDAAFLGFPIVESTIIPENMMAFVDQHGQVLRLVKIENGLVTYTDFPPDVFFRMEAFNE